MDVASDPPRCLVLYPLSHIFLALLAVLSIWVESICFGSHEILSGLEKNQIPHLSLLFLFRAAPTSSGLMEFESDSARGSYRECLRNHAASLGSYATDGCGEFSPAEQGGLTCAACGCHRNFHRKVVVAGATQVESEESERTGKRRARTKFSPEQKERMLKFAEKIGWRIQRRDKEDAMEIHRFCREIGVSRQVFKVWMHNHKNNNASSASSARKDHDHHFIHGLLPMSQ